MDHGARRQEERHQSRGGRRGDHDRYTAKERKTLDIYKVYNVKNMIRFRSIEYCSLQYNNYLFKIMYKCENGMLQNI